MSTRQAFRDVKGTAKSGSKPKIGLGLQGGAAHGAFTWGVLDRLLQEDDLEFGAITGSSSGAFNTALLAHGLAQGDRELARQTLRKGWTILSKKADTQAARMGVISPFKSLMIPTIFGPMNFDKMNGSWPNLSHPMHQFYMAAYGQIPHDNFPNPISETVEELVDFEAIANSDLDVFVNAINGRTGKHVVFGHDALDSSAIAASANLRYMMPPVVIDGDEYYDGGYVYNPYFLPLTEHSDGITDVLAIMVNPTDQEEVFVSPGRNEQMLNAQVFSSGAYENLRRLSDRRPDIHVHRIQKHVPEEFGASSKFNLDMEFLELLHDRGYEIADQWLAENKHKLGQQSSFDIEDFTDAEYSLGRQQNTQPRKAQEGRKRAL